MTTRMLIDARHPEETRVAVLKGNRIEEFDFESAEHKQIKGNIYLAKVTRVEPSLQAAFVDFGGNRHGFLAFNEIHPDYYQIPKEDRDALLAAEQEHAEEEARLRAEDDDEHGDHGDDDQDDDDRDDGGRDDADDANGNDGGRDGRRRNRRGRNARNRDDDGSDSLADEMAGEDGVEDVGDDESDEVATIEDGSVSGHDSSDGHSDDDDNGDNGNRSGGRGRGRGRRQGNRGGAGTRSKAADEARAKRLALRRKYKIQDVIQRRQVLLVQVVKEERGNKGAALTTYLSLAGRYCVLMPNSSHGGGISRKISSAADRKRLKQIVAEMSLPKSMGCIVRTAGLQRTKTEIKRDFDYLARLWDEIRENTMKSSAPALIHSDSDLIKRAIRDIYNREIEEVVVEGPEGYKSAKEFMKLLMPSHARRVKQYADPVPLFQRYGAEDQLSAMYDPVVQLKSGGYLVINPTEALVSIDINSGRSTKEHGIEQTALHTNMEAAKEIARQLRLRDMAGLVVIDFIDMEHNSSIRKVEKCMKDALKNDRARIQVGRISGFGLMEMSRQRLRTGVLEATTRTCPHCDGSGLVRTASSAGLSALRLIEDEAAKGKGSIITLHASTEAAIYLLNAKRGDLQEIEDRYCVSVEVLPEGEDEGAKMRVGSSGPRPTGTPKFEVIVDEEDDYLPEDEDDNDRDDNDRDDDDQDENRKDETDRGSDDDDDGQPRRKRRRRRGGRRKRGRGRDEGEQNGEQGSDDEDDDDSDDSDEQDKGSDESNGEDDNAPRKRRRRRRKSSRDETADQDDRSDDQPAEQPSEQAEPGDEQAAPAEAEASPAEAEAPGEEPVAEEKPKRRRTRRKKADVDEAEATQPAAEAEADREASAQPDAPAEEKPKKPRARRKKKVDVEETPAEAEAAPAAETPELEAASEDSAPEAPVTANEPVIANEPVTANEPVAANDAVEAGEASNEAAAGPDENSSDGSSDGPPRRGWWQRTFGN
ncbi:Rne/Rng family ribonuclease [Croceicoccus marinus]|uniref:Ribonuclease E n=1 Tax=Croceicoccus marinus TaxID=450378 RepID=A0A1Z1FA32_9SPHN|nr:ribonuclease E/G [Croceicoccus marinus]ARU15688.1 ribonuclease E/G [Croceicoccus marinus]